MRKARGRNRVELGIYYQDIDDYVFARFGEEESLQSGLLYRYLVYTPADATFTGIDGQISHQFSAESRLTLFGDYVRATLKEQGDNLPRIPPGRLGARYQWTHGPASRSEEHTSELQSLMRISYAVFCLKKKNRKR